MATPKHVKVVFRGIFNGTPEEWSFSTKWKSVLPGNPDLGVDDIDATGIRAALDAYMNTAFFQSSVWCTEWRAYSIGVDGNAEGPIRLEQFDAGDEVKGTSGTRAPTDISLCITTEADERGHAKLGRFYIPGPLLVLDNDHRLTVGNATTFSDNTVQFLKDLSSAMDVPAGPFLSTPMLNVSAVGAGKAQEVQRIRVGRVYDRIERRRRQMVEEYIVSGEIDW